MILKIIGIIILATVIIGIVNNNKTPKGLGVVGGKLSELSSKPNCISSQTDIKEKYVEPLKFIGDFETSKAKIKEMLANTPNAEIVEEDEVYIHVIYTTGTMRYKDDVEFYFERRKGLIHLRSASRIGYSDMGLNRKRYDEIVETYNK